MAYDGFAVAATVAELNERLLMGSISKVAQPGKDELLLSIKNNRKLLRLLISADPSLPMLRIREDNELSKPSAPSFCMSMRKHIGGGRIVRIYQPGAELSKDGLERIIVFDIEHLDELGDLSRKKLVCELMGKYSNIILVREDGIIIDSIRHVGMLTSSVREVLPGRNYFIPDQSRKADPYTLSKEGADALSERLRSSSLKLSKAIYMNITGFSPVMAEELCVRAGVDSDKSTAELSEEETGKLYTAFASMMDSVEKREFAPNIIYEGENCVEFSALHLYSMEGGGYTERCFDSMSEVISLYYGEREKNGRIRSLSEDIRHVLRQLTERCAKKLELQEKQYADAEGLDKYRVFGELLNTYGYELSGGEKELICENYYDEGRKIRIPLDERLSARENAVRYFDKYQKLKRTMEALSVQIEESRQQLYHLGSLAQALSMAENEADLDAIRKEMRDHGYIGGGHQKKDRRRSQEAPSEPLHFVSSDGIDIYVGRNNQQNEELSFRLADPEDWWFHAKGVAGSHVIAKTGPGELPDRTCLEAAALAAYYSRAGNESKAEVDYVRRKELRRVPKAAPGYVIYHTNYSIVIEPRPKI